MPPGAFRHLAVISEGGSTRRRLRIRYRKLWAVGLVGSALLYYVLGFHHL
jgi:hypothetical protein